MELNLRRVEHFWFFSQLGETGVASQHNGWCLANNPPFVYKDMYDNWQFHFQFTFLLPAFFIATQDIFSRKDAPGKLHMLLKKYLCFFWKLEQNLRPLFTTRILCGNSGMRSYLIWRATPAKIRVEYKDRLHLADGHREKYSEEKSPDLVGEEFGFRMLLTIPCLLPPSFLVMLLSSQIWPLL